MSFTFNDFEKLFDALIDITNMNTCPAGCKYLMVTSTLLLLAVSVIKYYAKKTDIDLRDHQIIHPSFASSDIARLGKMRR